MIFSVIATHYEGSVTEDEYIRFLDSIEEPLCKEYIVELIVMHDGPTTWDYKIIHEHYTFPITVVSTKERTNMWGHPLRTEGMKQSRGHYILNTNTDNEYEQGLFKKLYDLLVVTEADVVVGQVKMIGLEYKDGKIFYSTPRDETKSLILHGKPLAMGNVDMMQVVIKRSVWEDYGWWKDHREQSDGYIYQEIGERYGYYNVPILFGSHY